MHRLFILLEYLTIFPLGVMCDIFNKNIIFLGLGIVKVLKEITPNTYIHLVYFNKYVLYFAKIESDQIRRKLGIMSNITKD